MISLIVAHDQNRLIGVNDTIPWHSKDDMEFFRTVTLYGTVIMGYNTWKSLPSAYQPLPHRHNIVISSRPSLGQFDNVTCVGCLQFALEEAEQRDQPTFIIGGGQVYKEALDKDLIDLIFLTQINHTKIYRDGVYFPEFNKSKFNRFSLAHTPELDRFLYVRK